MRAQNSLSVTPVTNNEGYDFVAAFLPNSSRQLDAEDLKLQLLVSSRAVPGHSEITENIIGVQYADGSFGPDVRVPVNGNEVIEIDAKKAYWDITKEEVEMKLNKGVHVFSKNGVKMTVYEVNQIGTDKSTFSSDGAHVLPKQALGHEYIVACNSKDVLATEFVVMSTIANTAVNITIPSNVKSSKGQNNLTVTFDRPYQIYIVRSRPADPKDPNSSMDLSGTTICADHPIAVWSGNQAARFTSDQPNAAADHAFDQLLPIDRWGTQFIVPMTGLHTRLNELDIIARDNQTNVTITTAKGSQPKTLQSGEKWPTLIDAYHNQESSFHTLEDTVYLIKADKPVQVHLYTSSSVYNVDNTFKYQGDPSMTMISPLETLTDTAIFTTFKNPQKDAPQMKYELVVWAKKTTISSLKRNGATISAGLFKDLPGNVYSNYRYARISIPSGEEGYQILTAAEKGFGGYVCGLEDGQACLYPIGYDIMPVEDSLFLSKKYEPNEVHGASFKNTYPDKANGGGWYLDKVELPNQPTQYDTIFICDSSSLRFPAIIHNDWDEIKWEVMRINPNSKARTEYTDDSKVRQTGTLANPFLETRFYVLPEKNIAPRNRHPYEDFEVRAVLYREPILCGGTDKEKWQKDTLSTIVRAYRSYNDTTWLIRCDNDGDLKFFVDPVTKQAEITPLSVGENGPFTRKYKTANGCDNDSVVTLYVLLCQSQVEVRDPAWLCEADLVGINSQFGGFFKNFDFAGTLEACKKNRNTGADGWTYFADKLYWQFKGTDVIRTTDCNSEMQRWHDKYGAAYPRNTIGCDRSLTITLNVWPVTEYEHDDVTTCENQYTWSFDYNWYDGHFTKHDEVTYKLGQGGIHEGTNVCIREYPRSTYPPGTGFSGCIGERHILHLTFLKDNQTRIKEVEMCQDANPLVVDTLSDPDIADGEFSWTFDPRENKPGVHFSEKIECRNEDGCPYYMQYKITVNPVEIHRDTVVYCYEDGSRVEHKWEGHTSFWGTVKGQPNTKKRYDANSPLRVNRPKPDQFKDSRIIYELADTIPGTPCHALYYQTVIFLPPYSTSEKRAPISTEEWFEWYDVIWAGEKANVSDIPSGGKPVVVLKEYGRVVPEGWTVEYLKGDYLYALTTTTTTHQYRRDDGSLTAACDSTVQLLVQVADEQVEQTYAYTCNNDTPYVWQAGDTTIYLYLEQYQKIKKPVTITLEEHRKTVASLWPVAGIDAHFYQELTIYPSWMTAVDDHECQAPGETKEFKGITFTLDVPGVQEDGNHLLTEPKIWKNKATGEEVEVRCDSGEVVRMFVHPIYTEDVNKDLSTHTISLYTHDTVTFFTEPKILFVGQDFFTVHPEISGLEELKRIAKVNEAVILNADLVPELAMENERGGVYHTSQHSSGTKGRPSCDSTTFLDLNVTKTIIKPYTNLGDNGSVLDEGVTTPWTFGGDTSVARADGTRWHTFPVTNGDYFQFYYDKDGNIIGEVDYSDTTEERIDAGKIDAHYSENDDGTRTYLLIDTVYLGDDKFDVIVQYVVVYPTYLIYTNEEPVEVCASDMYDWEGHFVVDVSQLDLANTNRHVTVQDKKCAKRYADRLDNKGNPLCVDSICLLKLDVFGNANIPQTHPHCFNQSPWVWNGKEIYYDADAPISGQIRDTIKPKDLDEHDCYDVYVLNIVFDPAYGVAPYAGKDNERYRMQYIDPYIYDGVGCRFDDDFHWFVQDGKEHTPSNLYLYEYKTDIPDMTHFTDAQGNPTNKVPNNKVPTDFDFGFYTVRDSLKTVGCYCDSVLTLNYEIIDALPPQEIEATICKGEAYDFGGELLTEPGTYEKYIQEPGQPCKVFTTLHLSVEKLTTLTINPAPVCFGDGNTETTYAMRYSYKGNHPTSFSVYYKDDAKALGFKDIYDREISESEWKPDSVYVLNLPMPLIDTREDYPTPGVYHATISFKNDICSGSSLLTYDFDVNVNYPAWILEQRHGDLIVLLDSKSNGGHDWTGFQWYRDGQKMLGYTKPYLYVPEGLIAGAEYHVVLTETDIMGDTIGTSAPTCSITAHELPSSPTNPDKDHGPSSDYIAVTPTCVSFGGAIHILSLNENSSGEYRINTVDGQFVSKGEFKGKATPVAIPSVEGMYIVQVWSSNKESKESYRAVKVIVRSTCPNCDKSSF